MKVTLGTSLFEAVKNIIQLCALARSSFKKDFIEDGDVILQKQKILHTMSNNLQKYFCVEHKIVAMLEKAAEK